MSHYIATVQIVMAASSSTEMVDQMTALLSETPDNGVIDWSYAKVGAQRLYPTEIILPVGEYEEGSFEGAL